MKVQRLSAKEESALHQEILQTIAKQHKKINDQFPNIIRSLRDSEIQDRLCGEWGRTN